jgi:hypothetical protein
MGIAIACTGADEALQAIIRSQVEIGVDHAAVGTEHAILRTRHESVGIGGELVVRLLVGIFRLEAKGAEIISEIDVGIVAHLLLDGGGRAGLDGRMGIFGEPDAAIGTDIPGAFAGQGGRGQCTRSENQGQGDLIHWKPLLLHTT